MNYLKKVMKMFEVLKAFGRVPNMRIKNKVINNIWINLEMMKVYVTVKNININQ
jgi:hypothetical protein